MKIKKQVFDKVTKYQSRLILQTNRLKLENNNTKAIIYQNNKKTNW